jgi:hypothetical protein
MPLSLDNWEALIVLTPSCLSAPNEALCATSDREFEQWLAQLEETPRAGAAAAA